MKCGKTRAKNAIDPLFCPKDTQSISFGVLNHIAFTVVVYIIYLDEMSPHVMEAKTALIIFFSILIITGLTSYDDQLLVSKSHYHHSFF